MATIFTVHGTNATGPEQGTDWWQSGGDFESKLRALVEGEDGTPLKFQPVVWTGANSVTARREGGDYLLNLLREAENHNEHYCIVGHSHGGSIIESALITQSVFGQPLRGLGAWVTVGTPFISIERQAFVWRLPDLGRYIYAAVLSSSIMALFVTIAYSGSESRSFLSSLVPLLSLLLMLIGGWLCGANSRHHLSPRSTTVWLEHFDARRISLYHRDDEAISSLASLKSAAFPIFSRDFAVPMLSFVGVLALPLCLLTIASSATLTSWVLDFAEYARGPMAWSTFPDFQRPQPGGLRQNVRLIVEVLYGVTVIKYYTGSTLDAFLQFSNTSMKALFDILLLPALAICGSLVAYAFVLSLARPVSLIASRGLNRATWLQIAAISFGGDARGEICTNASQSPRHAARFFPALPAELEDQLSAYSDAAAGKTIMRLRRTVKELAQSMAGQSKSMSLANYLTWDELIHTNYFKNDGFCKLIAYTIGQRQGFRIRENFRCDPDFEKVAGWHEDLCKH